MFAFILPAESNIKFTDNGLVLWHLMKYGMNDVYITDSNNKNILPGNMKLDTFYNKYLIIDHFKKYSTFAFVCCAIFCCLKKFSDQIPIKSLADIFIYSKLKY